jgi:hypothetical protein
MSITAYMTLLGAIVSLGSWALIGQRSKTSSIGASFQVRMLQIFFLYMGIFCFIMFLPQLFLAFDPSVFPLAMAWGYVVGHVFLYVAFIYTLRLMFSMVPKLADKQSYAVIGAILVSIGITVFNAITMIWGTRPIYDSDNHVILFNAHPLVGAGIGLYAALSVLPAATLIIMNGVRNPRLRIRSFLLGIGFFVIMTAGPLHDNAKTWQLYMLADVLSSVGFFILAGGVLYRFEERIIPVSVVSPDKKQPSASMPTSL